MTNTATVCALFVGLASVWWIARRFGLPSNSQKRESSFPTELHSTTLAYSEKRFESGPPFFVGGIVDRAYRLPDGYLVLVEFKHRDLGYAMESDIVQLSVQRVAIQGETGERVVDYGYIVEIDAAHQSVCAIQVRLLNNDVIGVLAERYRRLLCGEPPKMKTSHLWKCQQCGYLIQCNARKSSLADTFGSLRR